MSLADDLAWTMVEEAVMRDRSFNEDKALSNIIRSYLVRRGMARTLAAFDADLEEYVDDSNSAYDVEAGPFKVPRTDSEVVKVPGVLIDVQKRKNAQILCLDELYDEAAAMLPSGSVVKIKLLCMKSLKIEDTQLAMVFIATKVAPLVPQCEASRTAHRIYLDSISFLLNRYQSTERISTTLYTPHELAREVNEELLYSNGPSSLNVLLSWADWQKENVFPL
ncbi:unnamed protein product [Phytomonas sp. EM1]|nr:unnamed protein product [Phytomonas sp. EM1]|eukprot:CCW60190.1 unnamed protein product [Phytomonas sp. isolate EM1]